MDTESHCRLCGVVILTGELCKACAEDLKRDGYDPFESTKYPEERDD